ncbi:DUF6333 family protein [Streptomyces sp. NBC_01465]|uniref:DUF6333 family protein n=1 Tax=Streptomyces sp. NBC_01465 TaxID=2903878 RepID=UPI002E307268|nr:DUF6333 family protein [Streptomyces sp. NBC_01465]
MSPVSPGTEVNPRHHGQAQLVVIQPPFTASLPPIEPPSVADHDPAAARAAVLALTTVAAVRHEDAPSRLNHPGSPGDREELDYVYAAAWGSTVKISDPALLEDGVITSALEDEFEVQKKLHPDARIVAVCERDFGASYTKILVAVPGVPDLTVEGWDELEFFGDLDATLAALGAGSYDFSPDGYFDQHRFLHTLTDGALTVYGHEARFESVFLVDRSASGDDSICEVWFP